MSSKARKAKAARRHEGETAGERRNQSFRKLLGGVLAEGGSKKEARGELRAPRQGAPRMGRVVADEGVMSGIDAAIAKGVRIRQQIEAKIEKGLHATRKTVARKAAPAKRRR